MEWPEGAGARWNDWKETEPDGIGGRRNRLRQGGRRQSVMTQRVKEIGNYEMIIKMSGEEKWNGKIRK